MLNPKRFEKEKDSLVNFNPFYVYKQNKNIIQGFAYVRAPQKVLDSIILQGKYYNLKITLSNLYPIGNIKLEIEIPRKIEMICRFGKYLLSRLGLPEDCIIKIIQLTVSSDRFDNSRRDLLFDMKYGYYNPTYICCKKYLLDYGKSSNSLFEYDDLMEISPKKMLGDYIKSFLDLCKKYSYTFDYLNTWDFE